MIRPYFERDSAYPLCELTLIISFGEISVPKTKTLYMSIQPCLGGAALLQRSVINCHVFA